MTTNTELEKEAFPDIWNSPALNYPFQKPSSVVARRSIRFRCGDRRWDISVSLLKKNSFYWQEILAREEAEPAEAPEGKFALREVFADTDRPKPKPERTFESSDENAVAATLDYMHRGDYAELSTAKEAVCTPIFHAEILKLGISNHINGLGNLAMPRFLQCIQDADFWKGPVFATTITRAYASFLDLGNEAVCAWVRSKLLNVAAPRAAELLAPKSKFTKFKKMINILPEFAADLRKTLPETSHIVGLRESRAPLPAPTKSTAQTVGQRAMKQIQQKHKAASLRKAATPAERTTRPSTLEQSSAASTQSSSAADLIATLPAPEKLSKELPAAAHGVRTLPGAAETPIQEVFGQAKPTVRPVASAQPSRPTPASATPRKSNIEGTLKAASTPGQTTGSSPTGSTSRKRKRANSPAGYVSTRNYRKCAICEASFFTALPWDRDNIYTRQCRTCADQLERRINYDEFDALGRWL